MRKMGMGWALLGATLAQAKDLSPFVYPSAPPFSSIAPPVNPGPGALGVANVSGLTTAVDPFNDITIANSIPLDAADEYGVAMAYAASSKKFGVTLGYAGTVGATAEHGFFGGVSARLGKASFGIGAVKLPNGSTTQVDLSTTIPMLESMAFTAVFRDLAGSAKPVLGVGYRGLTSQFQGYFEMPAFNSSDAGYTVGVAATVGLGVWTTYAAFELQTLTSASDYSVGIGRWLTKDIHMSLQYESLNRVTLGVELSL